MKRIAGRTVVIWLLILLLLGGIGFFLVEYFMHAADWVLAEGSPHIYSGSNIGCGVITDRENVLLLDLNENKTYASTERLRKSVIHWVGDRYGYISAPAVAHYAKELAGFDPLTGVYAYSGNGQAVLTLSAKVQMAALEAMGDYKGTVAVYNYKTGEILCAVSTPNYDPDNVPDIQGDTTGAYSGVYMNRFTQSVYIPGSIFKIVTTAAALEEIPDIREQSFTCTGTRAYGIDSVTCEDPHGTLDLVSAMCQSCNCAYAAIADQLGADALQKYIDRYEITQSLHFDGIKTASGNVSLTDAAPVQVAWSSIGQHKDQINPARFLAFLGGVANNGKMVQPYLVSEVSCGNKVTYAAKSGQSQRILPAAIAQELQQMMRNNVVSKYGVENFPDLTVCAKTGTGEVGGDKAPNAMFAGFTMNEEHPYAFIVAVENGGYGRQVCVPIISKILAACMEISSE